MDSQILQDIGLSNSEITVYMTLLELGPAVSNVLIKRSGLQSSVVHRAINLLLIKGLISYVKLGRGNQYQAADPDTLVNFIDEKRKRLLDVIPTLKEKQRKTDSNYLTEMFVGTRAIFSTLQYLIKDAKPKESFFSFSLVEPHDDPELILFYKNFNARRQDAKLSVKVLVNERIKSIYEKNYSKELLKKANVRYTSFEFPQGVIIFRDVLIFIHWGLNPFAVKITNEEMASQFKTFFLQFYEKEKNAY